MKHLLWLTLLSTCSAWSQSVDSTATPSIPLKSNFRSGTMFEAGFANSLTWIPAMRAFFRDNQVKVSSNLDRFVGVGFGYRRQRTKAMIHTFLGIDQSLLPPDPSSGNLYVARRQNLSGVNFSVGYDVANTRNQRVFINAGIGAIRYEYLLFRATTQAVPFQTILQDNRAGSVPSLLFESGFWDLNLEFSQREKRKHSVQWVSRLGYRHSLQAQAWKSDAYTLVNAPLDRISQLYLQLGICFSHNRPAHSQP